MSRKTSKAFTDTDFVMRTPEEPEEFNVNNFTATELDEMAIAERELEAYNAQEEFDAENPADAEGFIAPEYQDSEPSDAEPVNTFVIQEVPIPRSSRTKTLKYPIGTLKAGSNESFLVPVGSSAPKAVAASIRTFGYRNGFKVIIREEGPRIRVWRKA